MKRRFALIALYVVLLTSGHAWGAALSSQQATLSDRYAYMASQAKLPEMIPLDAALALDFYGIDVADCKDWIMMISADSLLADEVILLRAVDAATALELKLLLEERLTAKGAEARNYSPAQFAIIQQGKLIAQGTELALLVAEDIDALHQAYLTPLPLTHW